MSAFRIVMNGARGRMGRAIIACAQADPAVRIVAEVDEGDDLAKELPAADCVVDFSHHAVTAGIARACAEMGKSLVVGTTGHTSGEIAAIRAAANTIPIVFAPNFSVGVNTLFWLTRKAAEILGSDFDLEVVEMHHRLKQDAPSGTARRLAEILAETREVSYETEARHGRQGMVGERTASEIGVHALRGGDVVGDHTVLFAGAGERLELTHKAASRDPFATGALRAARWTGGAAPGLYDMQDVLGLR